MNKTFPKFDSGANEAKSVSQIDKIYGHIFDAIVDRRLQPGIHLKEDELCEFYGVGRTRLRTVLTRLAADHVVELVSNRGAFVARPTIEEASEVFRARRLLESHLIRRAAERRDPTMQEMLESHLECENAARAAGETSNLILHCGRYHQVLVDHAESPIMARFVRELIARSSLILAIYEMKKPGECDVDDHKMLAELVISGRADEAAIMMEQHLCRIESNLVLEVREKPDSQLHVSLGKFSV